MPARCLGPIHTGYDSNVIHIRPRRAIGGFAKVKRSRNLRRIVHRHSTIVHTNNCTIVKVQVSRCTASGVRNIVGFVFCFQTMFDVCIGHRFLVHRLVEWISTKCKGQRYRGCVDVSWHWWYFVHVGDSNGRGGTTLVGKQSRCYIMQHHYECYKSRKRTHCTHVRYANIVRTVQWKHFAFDWTFKRNKNVGNTVKTTVKRIRQLVVEIKIVFMQTNVLHN